MCVTIASPKYRSRGLKFSYPPTKGNPLNGKLFTAFHLSDSSFPPMNPNKRIDYQQLKSRKLKKKKNSCCFTPITNLKIK